MSDDYPRLKRFSNRRFSNVISEGFYLFGKTYLQLIIPLGLILIVSLIIKNLILVDLDWQLLTLTPVIEVIIGKDPSIITPEEVNHLFEFLTLFLSTGILNNLTLSVFNVFAMCLVSNYLFTKFSGSPSNFFTEVKKAFKGKLLLVILLLGVGISIGSFLLFIPSIIIFGFFIFYIFTYHSEEGVQPLKEARELARGAFWKIIGIFILTNLIVSICTIIFQMVVDPFLLQISTSSWYNPATRNYGFIILIDLLYHLPELLLAPLFICLLTSLYAGLKNKREQQTQYRSSYYQSSQSFEASGAEASKNLNSGMYCPFCGKYMKIKIDFCPHCGEKLGFKIK